MKKILYAIISLCFATSCNDFVDVIPKGNTIPETVDDLDKLMNLGTFGAAGSSYYFTAICYNVMFGELYCDDYTITQDPTQPNYAANTSSYFFNAMNWNGPTENTDMNWNGLYKSNYVANYVLDYIDIVQPGVISDRNEVRGRALVHRAMNYFILVNFYGKQYDASAGSTSATDLGVPLLLEADINKNLPRASVAKVYEQILDDLTWAISLLKTDKPATSNIPGLAAAYAVRARVQLWMQNYDEAYNDAVSALSLHGDLIDYNTCSHVNPAYGAVGGIIGYPTPAAINTEVIYARYKSETAPTIPTDKFLAILDTDNDLRYTLFSYNINGVLQMFYNYHNQSGINTGEVWLIKAEAALRKISPDINGAIEALDHLRKNRIKATAYAPTTITDPTLLLTEILNERRREIRLTEMAFFDRKRQNINPATARPMSRTIMGESYTLPLGDPRWQLPIPRDVMQLNPLMVQNER